MVFFGAFLIRLMMVYSSIYMKTALTTMIVSNLLLYGLADTLAQTLTMIIVFEPDTGPDCGFRIPFVLEKAKFKRIRLEDDDDDDTTDAESHDTESINSELGLEEDSHTFRLLDNPSLSRHTSRTEVEHKEPLAAKYDFRRLSLFMVWGFIQALLQYCWYSVLNSLYQEDNLFLSTLKRVLTDQLCYSPFSLLAFFLYTTLVMDRGNGEAVKRKLRSAYLPTLVVNYAVWPAAQFFNFLVMPVSLQVPFASTVGVFWNAYLSLKNATSK